MVLVCQSKLSVTCILLLSGQVWAQPKGSPSPWDWQVNNNYPKYNQYEHDLEILKNQPYFLKVNNNVTVTVGETAYLPCRVKNLGEQYTVSWIRAIDVTILTVSHATFSSDPRFSLVHVPRQRLSAADWTLKLADTRTSDQGVYECQINTEPKINHKVYLLVKDAASQRMQDSPYIPTYKRHLYSNKGTLLNEDMSFIDQTGPMASISGAPVQYVSLGSTVGLECTISGLSEPPLSLYWQLNSRVISAKERPGISLESERIPGVSTARLFISDVVSEDTGNYSCVSDIATPASVRVIVTRGGTGAALLRRNGAALLRGFPSVASSSLNPTLALFIAVPATVYCT